MFWDCQPGRTNGDFVINMFQVYPEYVSDIKVSICPSASGGTDPALVYNDADNLATVVIDNAGNTGPTSGVPNKNYYSCETRSGETSYLYSSWCAIVEGLTDKPYTGVKDLNSLVTLYPYGADALNLLYVPQTLLNNLTAGNQATFNAADSDIPSNLTNFTTVAPRDIYRTREGIERFLITDINNSAASAKAQSEIWIMGDNISTTPASYNHIPGGSNVLYMDGHVSFLKYPSNGVGDGPVNGPMANAFSIIDLAAHAL